MNNMLEIGKLVNTHGIRGEVKIQPWCDDPYVFDELESLTIDGREYEIERNRFHKTCQIVKLKGIDDINDAELLKNKTVYVSRDAMPLPEGRYFVADILNLEVREQNGRVLGRVGDVIKTGSNDVYVLKDTFNKKQILIPVIDSVVKEVNIGGGYVIVELMKGLIDE